MPWASFSMLDGPMREQKQKDNFWIKNKRVGNLLVYQNPLKIIMEGTLKGKLQGSVRLQCMKQIMNDMNCRTYEELKRKVEKIFKLRIAANQSKNWGLKKKKKKKGNYFHLICYNLKFFCLSSYSPFNLHYHTNKRLTHLILFQIMFAVKWTLVILLMSQQGKILVYMQCQ